MAQVTVSEDTLGQILRPAVADALDDRRDLLHEVLAEVLEDITLAEAIRDGRETDRVEREAVFAALDELS